MGHRVHRDYNISHFPEEKPKAQRGVMAHTGSGESPVASALQEPGVLGSPAPQLPSSPALVVGGPRPSRLG